MSQPVPGLPDWAMETLPDGACMVQVMSAGQDGQLLFSAWVCETGTFTDLVEQLGRQLGPPQADGVLSADAILGVMPRVLAAPGTALQFGDFPAG